MKRCIQFPLMLIMGMLVWLCTGCMNSIMETKTEKIHMEKTLNAKGIKQIKIDSQLANVQILTHEKNQIRAEVTGDVIADRVPKFQINANGSTATVQFSQDSHSLVTFELSEAKPKLTVFLPPQMIESLILNTISGHINANQKLQAKQINISVDHGNVNLNEYTGEKIKGNIKFGNMILKQLDASIDLQTDEGNVDISLRSDLKNKNQIQTKFGEVKIQFPKKPEALFLDIKTEFGTIRSNFPVKPSEKASNNEWKGWIGEPKTDRSTLSVTTDNGNVSLTQAESNK